MAKKNEKKAAAASMTMLASIFGFLSLGLAGASIFLPYWFFFPAQYALGWSFRNMGLLKLSHQFTDTIRIGADINWFVMRDSVCSAAQAYSGMITGSAGGIASASAMTMLLGVNCGDR